MGGKFQKVGMYMKLWEYILRQEEIWNDHINELETRR